MPPAITILAVWAAGLGAAAQFGKVSLAFGPMQDLYPGAGAAGVGLIVSLVGVVGLVFGASAGLLVSRIGLRRAMVAALAAGAAVSAVQAMLPPFPGMLALRVVEGVSHLAIVVVGPVAIAQATPARHLGLTMTLWSSFFGVAYALLGLIAPPVLAAGGVPALFLGHAAWMAVLALALAAAMPRDHAVAAEPGPGWIARHAAIYASPRLAAPALGFVFYAGLYIAILTLLPPMLPDRLRDPAAVGMPLASIAVSLTLGVWLLSRAAAVVVVQAGFAVALAASILLAAGWGHGAAMLAAALVLAGALGIVQGASFAAIAELNSAPEDRARAAGAVAQLGNLGTTAGTPLLGAAVAALGPWGLAMVAVPACAAGIALHAWAAARRRRR
ncbi:MAG: MFS transporter [Gemmobacter sp.]